MNPLDQSKYSIFKKMEKFSEISPEDMENRCNSSYFKDLSFK